MGRWVAVDHGTRRIGLAISDPDETFASPAEVLDAVGSHERDVTLVLRWAAQHEADGLVVGLPLNMNGSIGPQARLTQRFIEHLRSQTTLPVETCDERLSSFQADEWLAAENLSPAARKMRRDALAATAILQSFLHERRCRDTNDADPNASP